jgi:hypothetical protein
VREQLAGDEYSPITDEAMIATGFLRLGPSGGGTRQDALDDLIATTTQTFVGLTVNCARCHNHKFDPIPQKDYYRIQSIFAPTMEVSHPLAPSDEVALNRKETQRLDALQRPLRDAKTQIEAPYLKMIVDREIAKLPEYMQLAWRTPPEQRTPGQKLTVTQIERTVTTADTTRKMVTEADIVALMPADVKVKHSEVKAQIQALDKQRPRPLPTALAIGERGRTPQPTFFLHRGSPDSPGSQMAPGVLSVVSETEWTFAPPPEDAKSSWRRRGLAEWLVWKDNPLPARVMVNRPLAASLRRGHRPHPEQLRQDGGAPAASGAPGLAGAGVDPARLEPEGYAQADARESRLSNGELGHSSERADRSGESALLARAAGAPRSGDHPRQHPGGIGCARSHARRAVDLPVHRSGSVRGELAAHLARQAGRRPVHVAAQSLRLPQAEHPLSDVRDVRSAEPRQSRQTGETGRRLRRRR